MTTTDFHFSEIDSDESFINLAHAFGGKAIDNIIYLSKETGQGSIRKFDFEKGLHARVWDLNVNQPFHFRRTQDQDTIAGKAFTIVYILTPDAVTLNSPGFKKAIKLHSNISILLISNNVDMSFDVLPRHHLKALDLTFSAEWMMQEFNNEDPDFNAFMNKLKNNEHPYVYIDQGSSAEYRIAMDLHTHALSGDKGPLYLKARTLALASDFFTKAFTNHPEEMLEGSTLHQEKMLMVEQILEQHFEKNLPSIEAIARNASLSESTLKRHFKLMFGKSIYEYYLEKKMDYAKRLLMEKPLTVKEVAFRLGYEKTSNFIHMFKKFHTYSPGHLRKI